MPESIGEQLRKARLEKNIGLEQASAATHIRPRYLEALETDQRSLLPSAVQGKGFLRLYADYLGLTLQPLLDLWDGKLPAPTPTPPPAEKLSPEPLSELAPDAGAQTSQPSAEIENNVVGAAPQTIPLTPPAAATIPPQKAVSKEETPASKQIFQNIGQNLRNQREELNLSLSDVERYTHVRQRYLIALETGEIDELPSPVQGRGMLNNYAHFLAMDADALLLQFADALEARRQERFAPEKTQPAGLFGKRKQAAKPVAGWRRFITPDLLIGSTIIVGLFIFAIWSTAQVAGLRSQQANSTVPALSDVLLVSGTPTQIPSSTPVPPSNPLAAGEKTPESTAAVENNNPVVTAETQAIPSSSSPLQVYVVARQRAYLRMTVDKKVVFNGRLIPGNAYQYGGSDKIELLCGSASAIQVFFNQTDLGTLGDTGQVVSLIFTKDGMMTPTASFSPTPTRTLVPTATLQPTALQATATVTPFIP